MQEPFPNYPTLFLDGGFFILQMPPLKILFVCAKNQWRSPTAVAIYKNDTRLAVKSAGLSQKSPCVISAKLLEWADLVLVMEPEHASRIRDRFRAKLQLPDITSLGIPDEFPLMDPELIRQLKPTVEEILGSYL